MIESFKPEIVFNDQSEEQLRVDTLYLEKARFIHETCSRFLDGTLSSMERLQQKAYTMVGFCFAFMAFALFRIIDMVAYLQNQELHPVAIKTITALSFIIGEYSIVSLLLIFLVIYPRKKNIAGREPAKIISQHNLDRPLTSLLLDEASTYQGRIAHNLVSNNKASKLIKGTLAALLLAPLITFSLAFIF